jgi:hypothetical protein
MTVNKNFKLALLANAVFSLACSLPMVIGAGSLASYLGISHGILTTAGWVVAGNALFLLEYAQRDVVPKSLLVGAVAGDIAWVIISVLALLLLSQDLTTQGVIAVAFVAAIVGYFALAQGREILRK